MGHWGPGTHVQWGPHSFQYDALWQLRALAAVTRLCARDGTHVALGVLALGPKEPHLSHGDCIRDQTLSLMLAWVLHMTHGQGPLHHFLLFLQIRFLPLRPWKEEVM